MGRGLVSISAKIKVFKELTLTWLDIADAFNSWLRL
jgi:hypothetical protein